MSKKDYSSKGQEQKNKVEIAIEPKNDAKEQSTVVQKKSVKHIAAATAAKATYALPRRGGTRLISRRKASALFRIP